MPQGPGSPQKHRPGRDRELTRGAEQVVRSPAQEHAVGPGGPRHEGVVGTADPDTSPSLAGLLPLDGPTWPPGCGRGQRGPGGTRSSRLCPGPKGQPASREAGPLPALVHGDHRALIAPRRSEGYHEAQGGRPLARSSPTSSPRWVLGVCESWHMWPNPKIKYLDSRTDGLEMQILLLCFQRSHSGLLEPGQLLAEMPSAHSP